MSTAGTIKFSAACPVFDGTEYPYWKNRMRMHLEAIDVDLWYVVKNGVPKTGEGVTPANVKKFVRSTGFYYQEHHLWSSDQMTVWPCKCYGNIEASLGLALQGQRRRLNPERSEK